MAPASLVGSLRDERYRAMTDLRNLGDGYEAHSEVISEGS